ncbi:MAG TPA: hypothetical protein VGB42_13060 [Candidatus Thermoplasmatota archaeon]
MSFRVDDFRDLVRLLEERPEWRSEIRRIVLTDDLLRLPEQVARAGKETEQRFQELATRVDALAAQVSSLATRVDALAAQVSSLATRVDALVTQVATLAGHAGTVRGESLERRYRTRVFAYFGRVLRRARALTPDEVTTLLEGAMEAGSLADEEAHDLSLADVLVRGRRPEDDSTVYLVVEVSVGVGLDDVERALRRARLLGRTGVTALPVVAGEWVTPEAADAAQALRVWQLTNGRVVPPGELVA